MSTSATISTNFPATILLHYPAPEPGESTSAFSVEAQGTGSFVGLSYSVPAFAKGELKATIQTLAITSDNAATLHDLVMSMLSASEQDKVTSHEQTDASANISLWSMIGFGGEGGASADYKKTTDSMHSMGLTDAQITTIVNKMMDIASQMTTVNLDFTIDNSQNDFSVSGDLQLYTISGKITTDKGTTEYRFLADTGTAGNGAAPAKGKIIPLS